MLLLLVVSRLDVKPATRVLYLPTCVCSFVHNLWIHMGEGVGVFASAQIAREIWSLEKKFPVLELQPIIFRYQIHPNRCSVLHDMGPWQPATDESVARDQVHKHTHLHTLHIFTGALCCSYHPHHLQQWGKWELHAMTVIWWKFSEFSLIYLFIFLS